MYLNIINNIRHESKKKNKKIDDNIENKKDEIELDSHPMINNYDSFSYYSVFFGNLTKNWIKLTH